MKTIKRLVKTFMATLVVLITLLLIAWLIPEKTIAKHVNESIQLLEDRGAWEDHFTYAWGATLDNYTDMIMLKQSISTAESDRSNLFRAFYCSGYGRYWHGYLIMLRPLLAVMTYAQIRYLLMAVHIIALVGIAVRIAKRFDKSMVYGWIVAMITVNFVSLPFSLQFSWIFFIMYGAVYYLDKCYDEERIIYIDVDICAFFMVIGMLTSFLDLLTAPLLSLGIPLIYLLMLRIEFVGEGKAEWKPNVIITIAVSFSWIIGYVGCWAMKWLLSIPILKQNMMWEAISQIKFRAHGDIKGIGHSSFAKALIYNVYALLPPGMPSEIELSTWKNFFILLLVVIMILGILFIRYHETKNIIKSYIPIIIVICYPYIWYGFTTQHAQIHPLFTYRNQMITVMGGWIIVSRCIKWSKVKQIRGWFIHNILNKKMNRKKMN